MCIYLYRIYQFLTAGLCAAGSTPTEQRAGLAAQRLASNAVLMTQAQLAARREGHSQPVVLPTSRHC